MSDHIKVHNLALTASLYESAWTTRNAKAIRVPVLQPVLVSLDVSLDTTAAGRSDNLTWSVDYSALCRVIQSACRDVGSSSLSLSIRSMSSTSTSSSTPTSSSSSTSSSPSSQSPITAYSLSSYILEQCLASLAGAATTSADKAQVHVERVALEMQLPKAVLHAKSACVKVTRDLGLSGLGREGGGVFFSPETLVHTASVSFSIRELQAYTVIGVNAHEREDKQPIVLNLEFAFIRAAATDFDRSIGFEFARIESAVLEFVEASTYLIIEALAAGIAQKCYSLLKNPERYTITVNLSKPMALVMAEAPSATITRNFSDFLSSRLVTQDAMDSREVYATLALGSNLGDRFQNIELALRYLESLDTLFAAHDVPQGKIEVTETSFLYETAPMYVTDQPAFINCTCAVETTLSALDLLRVCKAIEKAVGRVPSIRFGPRAVDLDIITYGEEIIDSRPRDERKTLDNLEGHLVTPHPRMAEREFVLRPLADIIPDWVHPLLHLSVRSLLSILVRRKSADEPPMCRVVPFPAPKSLRPLGALDTPATRTYWVLAGPSPSPSVCSPLGTPVHVKLPQSDSPTPPRRTYVMATLNVTPDSFSDGGKHTTPDGALEYVRNAVAAGADIIDVGGYSTRPGSEFVSVEEETRRVVSFLHALRDAAEEEPRLSQVLVSIDTFRPEVMLAAVEAGAHCLNDVTALAGPDYPHTFPASHEHFARMCAVARKWCLPSVLMHSRGDANANMDYSAYVSVLGGVRVELGTQVRRAVSGKGSLRRWQVIVDPGVGFSKTMQGNVELLRCAGALTVEAPIVSSSPVEPPRGERRESAAESELESPTAAAAAAPYATPNWNPLAGYPQLIGTSRKSYLGKLLSRPLAPINPNAAAATTVDVPAVTEFEPTPKSTMHYRPAAERDFATAAAVVCAVQQGAAVVRVHEVQGMVDVVKVANAIWP